MRRSRLVALLSVTLCLPSLAQVAEVQGPLLNHSGDKLRIAIKAHKSPVVVVQGVKLKDWAWGANFDYEYGTVTPKAGESFLEVQLQVAPRKSREFSSQKVLLLGQSGKPVTCTGVTGRAPRAWYGIGTITTKLQKDKENLVETLCTVSDGALSNAVLIVESQRYPVAKFLSK